MKRKSHSPPKTPLAAAANPPAKKTAAQIRRERWYKILAVTLVPVLLFGSVELVLRLAGYGYPTTFFKRTQIAGREVYVENDQFGRRFFPPALTRIPAPTVVPVVKGSNTCRIFILGESAALGDPEPAFGFGRYLEVLLRERYPGTEFEVVCAAMTAINSHALRPIASECARREGDLWILYLGNNEVVGPFGAGTVLGLKAPPLFLARTMLALKATRTGQMLDALISPWAAAGTTPAAWEGMRMFLDAKTRHDDASRRRTDENFQKNLEAILRTARQNNVPVLLCTVASNLKDCAPFASLHSAQLSESQRGAWESLYQKGAEFEAAQNWPAALAQYQQAAAIDGDYAELQFRMGRCHLALEQTAPARHCFELARDLDALPFRATTAQNEIIRNTARKFSSPQVALLDVAEKLAAASPQQITGSEFFYEHVHLNFAGNQQLARLVAEQVATLLPQISPGPTPRDWPAPEFCEQQLGVTPWDRYRVYQNVRQRERQPPFTLQLNHTNQIANLTRELSLLRSQMNSNTLAEAQAVYRQALQQRPDDFILHGNFAKLLEDTGDLRGAGAEWERVCQLLPYHFGPDFYLGKLLVRLGRYDEAERRLTRALQIRPDLGDARIELGRALLAQKRAAAAVTQFQLALALQPDNARLHLHLAEALALQDQRDAALASLRRAIELRPDFWETRYLLGVELAVREDFAGARKQFAETVRLKPDHALAHLNLGVALAKENRLTEAIQQFRETLRLAPSNRMAAEYLAKLHAN